VLPVDTQQQHYKHVDGGDERRVNCKLCCCFWCHTFMALSLSDYTVAIKNSKHNYSFYQSNDNVCLLMLKDVTGSNKYK